MKETTVEKSKKAVVEESVVEKSKKAVVEERKQIRIYDMSGEASHSLTMSSADAKKVYNSKGFTPDDRDDRTVSCVCVCVCVCYYSACV